LKAQAQKITSYLWFDGRAEEAMRFYVDVFSGSPVGNGDSRVVSISRHPDGPLTTKGMEGKVLHGVFELAGQRFFALDGGPMFRFTEAVSLWVECSTQAEVDYFWGKLSADPASEACGWLKDKYGLSWQIIPTALAELMNDPDPAKSGRVMQAILQMKKIDIEALRRAHRGA
jgi:predicted 3-demethylubiquinone-9 3-methyltransferase (glyoxalase superfamily)